MNINLKGQSHLTLYRDSSFLLNVDELTLVPITYSELKNLRDTSSLVPGTWYRITNYHTTVSPTVTNARSADHQFDVIVRADDASHLNETGYAAHHEGDEYFANCKLEAWELQYSLDNDYWSRVAGTFIKDGYGHTGVKLGTVEVDGSTYILWDASGWYPSGTPTRVVSEDDEVGTELKWYDPETGEILSVFSPIASKFDVEGDGQGTILMLKDEYGNQCPYDFKSIQFKRWAVTDAQQDRAGLDGKYMGAILKIPQLPKNISIEDEDNFIWAYTFSSDATGGEQVDYSLDGTHNVNNNVIATASHDFTLYLGHILNDIVFYGKDVYLNQFGLDCIGNTFGGGCYNNSFGVFCLSNLFGDGCINNIFGNGFTLSSLGQGCVGNSFGYSCGNSSFGNDCVNNLFGNFCGSNSFGNNCLTNSFGNNCWYNSFGDFCSSITVFDGVQYCSVTGGTNNAPVKNAQILNGVAGTSGSDKLTITFDANQNKTQVACLDSQGQLVIYYAGDVVTEDAVFASEQPVDEVHIVNDLNSGGVNDVLSAEMGKVISKTISKYIDLGNVYEIISGAYIDNTWKVLSNYNSCCIKLQPNSRYRISEWASNLPNYLKFTLIKSIPNGTPSNNDPVDYSTGWTSTLSWSDYAGLEFITPNDTECYLVYMISSLYYLKGAFNNLLEILSDNIYEVNNLKSNSMRYTYIGESFDFKDKLYSFNIIYNNKFHLGMAVSSCALHKNILVVLLSGTSGATVKLFNVNTPETGINNNNINISLNSPEIGGSQIIENIGSYDIMHCNSCAWGDYYDPNDPLPILFIAVRNIDGRGRWAGYRFTNVIFNERNTPTSFNIELVQTIILPTETASNGLGYPNIAIDPNTRHYWAYSRYNGGTGPTAGVMVFTDFGNLDYNYVTDYSVNNTGTEIDLTENNIIRSFSKPGYSMATAQSGCIKNGYLLFGQGYQSLGVIYLNIVNLNTEDITRINLYNLGYTYEPEGVVIDSLGHILIPVANGNGAYVINF